MRLKPRFSKRAIDRAGIALFNPASSDAEKAAAWAKVNYWRDIHREPLQMHLACLEVCLSDKPDVLIAGRMKKMDTIIDKLARKDTPNDLSCIYDIAGCRIVVKDLAELENVCGRLVGLSGYDVEKSLRRDYLARPKRSGYRSKHMIFKYEALQSGHTLFVELQVRTELQHAWATAVELYDMVTEGSRLKFNEFQTAAGEFFCEAARLVRMMESDVQADRLFPCIARLNELNARSGVLDTLSACSLAVTVLGDVMGFDSEIYCLVDANLEEQTVGLVGLPLDEAVEVYFEKESRRDPHHDYVLVKGSSLHQLQTIYPNYFGDISRFLRLCDGAMGVFASDETSESGLEAGR